MKELINVPGWLKIGTRFTSEYLQYDIVEVMDIWKYGNAMHVKLIPNEKAPKWRQPRQERDWILSHVLAGFERGEYKLL